MPWKYCRIPQGTSNIKLFINETKWMEIKFPRDLNNNEIRQVYTCKDLDFQKRAILIIVLDSKRMALSCGKKTIYFV